jgi:thymidylate synthase
MKEQIGRTAFELPKLKINSSNILEGEFDIELLDYQSHPAIKGIMST